MNKRIKMINIITWVLIVLQTVGTGIVLRILPDEIPMHFGNDGTVDRYGSKNELLFLVFLSIFLILMFKAITKSKVESAEKSEDARERQSAETSRMAMTIIELVSVITMIVAETVLVVEGFNYSEELNASDTIEWMNMAMNIIIGIVMIFMGNIMPKSRNNGMFGVRTSWSRYNDETWMRSNRFGGKMSVLCGFMCIIMTLLVRSAYCTLLVLGVIMVMAMVMVYASYRIYQDVVSKSQN